MNTLTGRVAVVAGATRGAGRGIARGLGEAGAVVYCTGRSVTGRPSPYKRPETIDETAEMIAAQGGTAVPVRVDHTIDSEVAALFERVEREHGRLDVLVNSIAGEEPMLGAWGSAEQTDLTHACDALRQSLVSHMITLKRAIPLMKKTRAAGAGKRKGGTRLIVEVTEHDMLFGGGNLLSLIVKTALKSIAINVASELRKDKIAVVAITPGYLRSESMLDHYGVTEANWRDGGKKDPNFLESETPLFVGRAVAALAADPRALDKSGEILSSWALGNEYGFTDADGRRPDWGRHFREVVVPSMSWMKRGLEEHVGWLERQAERGRRYLGTS